MTDDHDIMFWCRLYDRLVEKCAAQNITYVAGRFSYQVDGKTIELKCLSDEPDAGYRTMDFWVNDLYRITFEIIFTRFIDSLDRLDVRGFNVRHPNMTDDEFEHHMTMLKLQVAG